MVEIPDFRPPPEMRHAWSPTELCAHTIYLEADDPFCAASLSCILLPDHDNSHGTFTQAQNQDGEAETYLVWWKRQTS